MQVNGSFNHKAAQTTGGCYSDMLGKFSSGERVWGQRDGFGVHGDGRTDLGLGFDLLPKTVLWTRGFPRLPHCNVLSEGENVTAKAVLGFRTFES